MCVRLGGGNQPNFRLSESEAWGGERCPPQGKPTFSVVEVEFDGLALVDVQVGEPHCGGEQHQQEQELELLPDLLHGEAQHPGSHILR